MTCIPFSDEESLGEPTRQVDIVTRSPTVTANHGSERGLLTKSWLGTVAGQSLASRVAGRQYKCLSRYIAWFDDVVFKSTVRVHAAMGT